MAEPSIPSSKLRWANAPLAGGDVTEPDNTTKSHGWQAAEEPPHSFLNYWMNVVYLWVAYLDGLPAEAMTWTAAHVFGSGITVNQDTLNADAITATGNGTGSGANLTGGATGAGLTVTKGAGATAAILADGDVVSTSGSVVAAADLSVGGSGGITGNLTVGGTAGITGNTTVGGTLDASGNVTCGSQLSVADVAHFSDAVTMSDALHVVGAVQADSTLHANGNLSTGGTLAVTGNTNLFGNLTVVGPTTLDDVLDAAGGIFVEAKQALTLLNSWVTVGGSSPNAYFWKDPMGTVQLEAMLNAAPASSGTIATLPTGYRPGQALYFDVTDGTNIARITVATNGNVTCSTSGVGSTTISLSGVRFRAN